MADAPTYPFAVPPLRFGYDALEPFIDEETMRLHHDAHHRAYVDKLNAALAPLPRFHGLTIEAILRRLDEVPEAARSAVRNQGGGHANHQFLWKVLGPGKGPEPDGALADALVRDFGSVADFKARFEAAAAGVFGSGWAFLVVDPAADGRLEIVTLPNQDSLLPLGKPGLFACDVWEHAYYLRYRNRRAEYLKAVWDAVDWDVVAERLQGVREGRTQL